MNATVFNILIGIAGLLSVLSLIKPEWKLLSVSVLLICIALITKAS